MEGITFEIWGLGGALATTLVVQLLKQLLPEIQDRWAVLVSVLVGVGLSVLANYAGLHDPGAWRDIAGAGVLAGLAACGIYSAAKRR